MKEKKYKKFLNAKKFQDDNSKNNYLKHEMSNLSSLDCKPKRSVNLQFESTSVISKHSMKKSKPFLSTKSSKRMPNKNYFLDSECTNNNNSTFQKQSLSDTCLNRKKCKNIRKNSKSLEEFDLNNNEALEEGKCLEVDDDFLNELNKNFENLLNKDYADACVAIYYVRENHSILLNFYSIINNSNYELNDVNVILDVFHKDISKKRIFSKLKPINIKPRHESKFKHTFSVKLNRRFNIKALILNVYIIGDVFKEKSSQSETDLNLNKANILLRSKSSLSHKQILGGAHIVVKNFL